VALHNVLMLSMGQDVSRRIDSLCLPLRVSITEGCKRGATVLCKCAGEDAEKIRLLLLQNVVAPQDAARSCAVLWAARLFPFSDVPARYVCVLGAGDTKVH